MTKLLIKKIRIKIFIVLLIGIISCFFLISGFISRFVNNNLISKFISKNLSDEVIVEYGQNIVGYCKNDLQWRDCYSKKIAELNHQIIFRDTVKVLEKVKQSDKKTLDCHLIAHRIATSEVEKSPKDWIKIFDYVDQSTCINGFIHGVLEGRSRYETGFLLDENSIPSICGQIEKKTSLRINNVREQADEACSHAMGHILLVQENGNIDSAIKICSKVPNDIRRDCHNGLFMENITKENLVAHGIAKKTPYTKSLMLEIEKKCQQYKGDAGRSCWREMAHLYTAYTNNSPQQVHQLCYQMENKDYARECYLLAVNIMTLSQEYSDQQLADTCKDYWKNETKDAEACTRRAIRSLLGSSINFIDRAITFCEAHPAELKKYCFVNIGEELSPRTDLDKRDELCQKVSKDFLSLCATRS